MAEPSTFYYNGNATPSENANRDFVRELPIYAIHCGEGYMGGWQSNLVTGKYGFKQMMDIVNVQVPVFLVLPRIVASQVFRTGRQFEKLAIYAYKPLTNTFWSDGGYMAGEEIAMVLRNLSVVGTMPIMAWKGLPSLKRAQEQHLEKTIGRETWAPVAVKLFVDGDCTVVS